MEIHPLIDPYAVHFDTFAGDVYTLDTAGITLTAGTLTAEQITSTDDLDVTGIGTFGDLVVNTTGEIQFRDADISIGSTLTDGILDMSADDAIYMFYDNADVGDAVDGQSLYIYRRAGEYDKYIRFYTDQFGESKIEASYSLDFLLGATPKIRVQSTGILLYDKLIFTQTDLNEYIDSLNDGYMDYGATTAHRFNNDIISTGDVTAGGDIYAAQGSGHLAWSGDTNTYITHPPAGDNIDIVVGGTTVLSMDNTGPLKISTTQDFGASTLTLTDPTQDYMFLAGTTGYLALQGQSSNTTAGLQLFSKDVDETDSVLFQWWGKGLPGATEPRHRMLAGWLSARDQYEIFTEFHTAGNDRPIVIYTEGNTDQFKLNIDGTIGLGGTTNRTTIEADGTIRFDGTATVWNDMQFQISDAKTNPANTAPSWETFTPNTSEYAFSINDEVDTSANEIPHWWKEGTAGNAHIHITTKAINNVETTYAKFTVTFTYADTDEVWVEAPLTAEIAIANPTAALTNFYLDLGDITLTNYLIEAQMKCRVKRIDATTGTEYAGDIFITQIGIHFEEDTIGSRIEKTK